MEEKNQDLLINAFIELFEEYGEDYQGDGTKERILEELKNGNLHLLREISEIVDRNWIQRTQELGTCRLFTEYRKFKNGTEVVKHPYLYSNYMDSYKSEKKIPTLRIIRPTHELKFGDDGER